MSQCVYLQSWDRFDRVCSIDIGTGRRKWRRVRQGEKVETVGFIKSCLVGPSLLAYQKDGIWYLQAGGDRWPLSDPLLSFKIRPLGIVTEIRVEMGRVRHLCICTQLLSFLAKRLDPTYDSLDTETSDFPTWLAERRKEALGERN